MKRVCVLLLLLTIALLVPVCSSQAADLQAGWFVDVGAFVVWDWDGMFYYPRGGGYFTTPTNEYGPFTLTGPTYGSSWRRVTVTANTYGVGHDQSLILPLGCSVETGAQISYITFGWRTDYDSSQMHVELWRTGASGEDELVWSQHESGSTGDEVRINGSTMLGPYYYKIVVAPEPASAIGLLLGTLGVVGTVVRWRRA
jgi:hypothetical protein